MIVEIKRDTYTDNSTASEIFVDGEFFCLGLEPRKDTSKGKPYCIPAGTYQVTIEESSRFDRLTPHVQNVPGFTEIEWHPGNAPTDTEGCCLVGATRSEDWVGDSLRTFEALMQRLAEPITAIYTG